MHGVLSLTALCAQPVEVSHESAVHALLSLQSSVVPGVHTPD
jgi:hypothetical protein